MLNTIFMTSKRNLKDSVLNFFYTFKEFTLVCVTIFNEQKTFMQFLTFTAQANLRSIVYVVLCILCGVMCSYTYLLRFSIHKHLKFME